MDLVTRAELLRLAENPEEPCASLFVPTARKYGEKVRQSRIWLKNLLSEVEESLAEHGLRTPERRRMLSEVSRLVDDRPFWEKQSDGLAIFISPELTKYYRVPLALEARALVGPRFHIKPLLPLLPASSRFLLLSLGQNGVKLHECTRHGMIERDLGDTPRNIAEALKYDDPEKQLQYHTGTSPANTTGGRRSAIYHGQGSSKDASKDALERYLREVDKGLSRVLRDDDEPLVLAGVDYVLSMYRVVTTYPRVLGDQISGNPWDLRDAELLAAAWAIVEPVIRERLRAATRNFAAAPHRSTEVEEIVRAAHEGRVELLFVDEKREAWGRLDEASGEARVDGDGKSDGEELLNAASAYTLSRGGTVYALETEEIPGEGPAAAVFRY